MTYEDPISYFRYRVALLVVADIGSDTYCPYVLLPSQNVPSVYIPRSLSTAGPFFQTMRPSGRLGQRGSGGRGIDHEIEISEDTGPIGFFPLA